MPAPAQERGGGAFATGGQAALASPAPAACTGVRRLSVRNRRTGGSSRARARTCTGAWRRGVRHRRTGGSSRARARTCTGAWRL